MKKRVLFLIHDLGPGGAEKVLVNLVNNMDSEQFDITVMTLFDEGVNRQFLLPHITYRHCFRKAIRGNSHLMKLLSPKILHRWLIREKYDVEVAYLEGPCARIVSGCPDPDVRKIAWIHVEQTTRSCAAQSFRSYDEAMKCYNSFDKIACVSETVRRDFLKLLPVQVPARVVYNTNESDKILSLSREAVESSLFCDNEIRLVGVGRLLLNKGFHRLLPIVKRLRNDGFPVHFYILGTGSMQQELEKWIDDNAMTDSITMLGYQINPYKYVANCDLFVCASRAEGFSTAATEALIVGTPVCTVEVSGMKEMLGENNEYGIVTENNDEALYQGIRRLLDDPDLLAHYRTMATERGKMFCTAHTVDVTEEFLLNI